MPRIAVPTRARSNLGLYVSDADYPEEASFNGEQGWVAFRLYVGPDGRVGACQVTASSGSPSLDEATCSIMRSRARFDPAKGADGAPVADTVSARINWRLLPALVPSGDAGAAPPPSRRAHPAASLASLITLADAGRLRADPRTVAFELDVGADGRVTNCVPTAADATMLDEATCRLMRERARFTPAVDAAGRPVADRHRGHIDWRGYRAPPIMVTPTAPAASTTPTGRGLTPSRGVVPDAIRMHASPRLPLQGLISADDYPAAALRDRDQGSVGFMLSVDAAGRVAGCVILSSSGSAALDSATCRILRSRARFTPARDAGGQPVEDRIWDQIAWRLP